MILFIIKNIPIFIDENININLFEDNENENKNQINDESQIFIDNLKNIFRNRMNELTKQYYMTYDFKLSKKYQRVY